MTRASDPLDFSRAQSIHIVGIGGAGMSAIATVLAAMGHTVSGSDLKASPGLERLAAAGIVVHVGHDAAHLPADLAEVGISTAIPDTNPEVVAAVERQVPVRRRAELLAAICRQRRTVAVAGTHGKTTTSSMLALVLMQAGLHPSFIIGGDVNEIGTGAVWDTDGDLFVVEADESDGTFLELARHAAVVTNVEPDHLEHYGGWLALEAAFDRFVAETSGPVVLCADDAGAAALAERHDARTYGFAGGADVTGEVLEATGAGTRFAVRVDGAVLGEVHLPIAGMHNARNALGAVAAGLALGAPFDAAAEALGRFAGVARRFQHRGVAGGVTFIDDYAHLPTEVRAAIAAARAGDWQRVVCVFQPHRYSRTATLWQDFAGAFDDVDLLIVTDIYASGERPRPGITGKLVLDAALDAAPDLAAAWLPHRDDLVRYLAAQLRPGDLCLTLGAGDLTTLPDTVRELLGTA